MKKALLFFLLLLSINSFADVPYNKWWQKANTFYQQKNYDSAVIYYEKLASLSPENAAIFYNLGNSYYRLNRIGQSVLNYERALKLNPDYKEANDNLELTQSRIINRIQPSGDVFFVLWWNSLTRTSMAEAWAILALAFFLLTLLIIVFRRIGRAPSWLMPQFAGFTLTFCLVGIVLAYSAANKKESHDRAVIMEQDTPLKDNMKASKTQLLLPEGTVIKIESEEAGWAEVKLPDGRGGWMKKDALERI